jgi:hypothetical protein
MNDYSRMMCFVVAIPKIEELNGYGHIPIGRVIAGSPEKAVDFYLRSAVPVNSGKILEYLRQHGDFEKFAIRAESHDVIRVNSMPYTRDQILEQNKRIADEIERITGRSRKEIDEAVAAALPVPKKAEVRTLASRI